jgi:hypothetical protein
MRIALFLFSFCLFLEAGIRDINIAPKLPENHFMGIKILDQKELYFDKIQGVKFAELSDVTYDDQTHILYFVGDKGSLFSFRAHFGQKIDMLKPLDSSHLKNKRNKKFRRWKRDSEGLTLDGKRRLLISFEGEAKIAWFHKNSAKKGNLIKKYKLPKALKRAKNYRSRNKSLESLAWHAKYGILTATEWPLKQYDKKLQTIYTLGKEKWHFRAEPEGKSAVVAMEVMSDGNVLILERSYIGMLEPFVITLKKVMIKGCKKKICPSKVLAKMNSHKGWDIDNFEGLAKVDKNRYVMVSDNGDNFFQKTLLVYFEIL